MTVIGIVLWMVVLVSPALADVPRDLDDYVVLAVREAELGDGVFVAGGDVGVNTTGGRLRLDREVFFADDSAAVADDVAVGEGSSLADVFANDVSASAGVLIRGAGPTAFTPAILTLPPLPSFAPGSTPIVASGSAPIVLSPGPYGAVVVTNGATLQLSGGHYDIAGLAVLSYGRVIVDASATIDVRGDLRIGAFGSFGPASGAIAAGDVRVNVGGSTVRVGRTAHIAMDLFAPDADTRFERSVRAEGRFVVADFHGEETLNLRRVGSAATPPPSQLCTTTQHGYGADASPALVSPVVVEPGLPATVGAPGISSLTVADGSPLACFLPTSGVPASLCLRLPGCAGDHVIDSCDNPPILDGNPGGDSSGGLGGGALVGEVIAAKLNVARSKAGLTPAGLESFVLPRRLCTTACPGGRVMNPNPMVFQTGAVGVADGLTTVGGLLAFADQVLSNTHCRQGTCTATTRKAALPPNPIRLSDIQHALRAINECFEGCATVTPCAE